MKGIILTCLFTITSLFINAQAADDILGTYMTDKNEGMVEITKRDGKYFGKLMWTKTIGKLDEHNPDPKQRAEKLAGKEILKSFTFDGKEEWNNGTIYDPKNGKTYNCKISRDAKGNLFVRGYIGISLIGRTTTWIKVK